MKASCSSQLPGSEVKPSPWSGSRKNARSWRGSGGAPGAQGISLAHVPQDPSLDSARAGNALADRFLFGTPFDHADIQLHAPGDLRWRGPWLYSRALRSLLRSALPRCLTANFPLVAGLHGHLPGTGLPGCISDCSVGAMAALVASLGG